ncbi:MAG: DNA-processing protein DprA [Pirellulaceae bacterium]
MDGSTPDTERLDDALRLALIPGVGPRTRKALLARFGSARGALQAAPSQLREVPGMGPKLTQAMVRGKHEIDVAAIKAHCAERGMEILTESAPSYPRLLREIHDPPGVLFVRGELRPEDAMAIAVVGSRHATRYGLRQAERLGRGLTRAGLTVVSGLARGVDASAHRGALAGGGRTIAVLASGLSNVYPPEHAELADEITQHGALLSEVPPFSPPMSGAFPQRNRLITGLSLGVIVVEAALRSGALISAEHAMEQGRDVFAVPGRVESRMSRGCHRLLREGAKLVESVDDVLDELGPLVEPTPTADGKVLRSAAELQLNEQEQAVLAAIGNQPTGVDDIVFASGLPVHRVLATLSVLEMRRLVRRISGCLVARV